jgi:hypothetical protein
MTWLWASNPAALAVSTVWEPFGSLRGRRSGLHSPLPGAQLRADVNPGILPARTDTADTHGLADRAPR